MAPIGCVVEGHGEKDAVPVLVRRIAADMGLYSVKVHSVRKSRPSLVQEGGLEQALALAALPIRSTDGSLVLLDADDDCPGALGPQLVERARLALPHLPVGVVLAKCEFEAWLLAAAESFAKFLREIERLLGDVAKGGSS